jgi:raffinose/stachyose/melibiose transport system substrate-binding protein
MKNKFLVVLLMAMVVLAAFAGGDEEKVTADGQEIKTVTVRMAGYHPTEWTTRSAEHPEVVTASRILADAFEEKYPNIKIKFIEAEIEGESDDYLAWFSARMMSGTAPDFTSSLHNIEIQNGWTLPIGEYLDKPNPFVAGNKRWRDLYHTNLMTSLIWEDDEEYCAPISAIWPYMEVGLLYNKDYFAENGLKPATNWTELVAVSKKLKELGSGLSPWAPEKESGNFWPLALQLLPPMMQEVAVEMDLNDDMFVNIDEALIAYRNGLIGPKTELYRSAIDKMTELASYWVDDFSTVDLETMFKNEEIHLMYMGAWGFSDWANDPSIEFDLGYFPAPMPLPSDFPEAKAPKEITKGDGTPPMDYIFAVQGPDFVIIEDSVKAHDNVEETILWWQFLTSPENNAFLVNENEAAIPAVLGAPLGPIFSDIAKYKMPMYDYSIAWWGMGLFWDAASFQNWRKIYMSHLLGEIDNETFYDRLEQEFVEGSARFAETLSTAE